MEKTYDPSTYRIVFFSGSPIGIPFLEHLNADKRFDIVWVVTMPDKPIGRGHTVQANSIKITAEQLSIPTILTPTSINPATNEHGKAVAAQLHDLKADYFIVVAYGKIMPQAILDIPHFWCINVHGSILPEYRWASPLQSVFLDDRAETGVTIMNMNAKMDEWDIISTYEFKLPFARTSKDLFEKVKVVWPKVLADAVWDLSKWHITARPQDASKATYCHKIEKQDGYIDLRNTPLQEVYNKYRAYALRPKIRTTWPDTFPKIAGKTLVIEELICDEQLFSWNSDQPICRETGLINPAIKELSIKPEGKKAMNWKSFKNGYLG